MVNHITSSPHYPQYNYLLKSMYRFWKVYLTRQKKRGKIYSNAWWSTTIHLLVAACNHQCKPCKTDAQDQMSPCLMQLDYSLVYSLRSWELFVRMNICLYIIYILGKMLYTKMLQASGGIQPPLPAYVHSQEVIILLQEKLLPIGRHKLTWSPANHKQENRRWTFWCTI